MKRILVAFALTMPLLLQACGQSGSESNHAPATEPGSTQQQSSPENTAPATTPQPGTPEQQQSPTGSNSTTQ